MIMILVGIAILIVLICIIAIMILMKKMVSYPIKRVSERANRFGQGDFSEDISEKFTARQDEIGLLSNSFQLLLDNMNDLMMSIKIASEQVASGAVQISESSEEISQGATEQASSVEELTAAIEEIASQTKLNAENAGKVDTITKESKKVAEIGNEKMKYMLKAMDDINVSSKSISKIIKAIDDIAFQTNILALNAAVEAARAGQHGKGFAVVAEEVRNLAAKSANAAKETTDLIEGSINKVEGGTKIAVETAEELKRIVEGVSNAAVLVEEISVSTKEQATGIEQVNQGLMQVSQVIQANSATSQESAAASEELSGQATILKEQISKFKLKDIRAKAKGENSQISPDVLKALDGMKQKKDEQKVESKSSSQKTKISLSDTEFGKY
ncbi:Methyl-accepting chemotaxis protein III [bioreactor metagenome]|uniref:Methyl-accepting chemotaxis protein III n=1 Tax=bioreactor metagenome TaxID=1076179 RepID=A0A644Z3D3_9ZZZZ